MTKLVAIFLIVSGVKAFREKDSPWKVFRIMVGALALFAFVARFHITPNAAHATGALLGDAVVGWLIWFLWGVVVKDRRKMDEEVK
jgi:hypothetical protein